MNVSILPVTDAADLPTLVSIFIAATKYTDTFYDMLVRYGPKPPYDAMLEVLDKSLKDPSLQVFKAVLISKDNGGNEIEHIVGMSQWKVGYIVLEKYDPFEKGNDAYEATKDMVVAPLTGTAAEKTSGGSDQKAVNPNQAIDGFKVFRDSRVSIVNSYIRHIRGKRHVFLGRIAVHPDHQRKGIATALLQWGVDLADSENMVAYLNARPAAMSLYQKAGYRPVATTTFKFDDLDVAPVTSMLREPKPWRV